MEIFQHIDAMLPYIHSAEWDSLEAMGYNVCAKLAGAEQADAISSIDLSKYQERLCLDLTATIGKARISDYETIYFEYDLDNGWNSHFFFYDFAIRSNDEDALCDYIDYDDGPSCKLLADYYEAFDEDDRSRGTTIYLIAKTVATFGRCTDKFAMNHISILIGFHDQHPVMRIQKSRKHKLQ